MNRMLVFLPSSGLGGCEHYAKIVVGHLRARRLEVYLALPEIDDLQDWVSSIESLGVHVLQYAAGETGENGFPDAIHQEREARTVVEACAPQLVVAILPWPLAGAGIQAVISDKKLPSVAVFQLFCRRLDLPPDLCARFLKARTGGQIWVAVSNGNRESIAASFGVPTSSITVAPNGIDITPESESRRDRDRQVARTQLGIPSESWVLVTIARLTAVKRVGLILDALALLPDIVRADVTLLVLGDGEEAADLRTLGWALGLRDQVRFVGHVSSPQTYLLAADVYVTASCCEGLAFSTLEAMSVGLPVVAASESSNGELVREKVEGLLFSGGAADSLAEALEQMRWSPAVGRMGQSGRRRVVTSFTSASMLTELEQAITTAWEGRPNSRTNLITHTVMGETSMGDGVR